jgi:hypothetical protein
MKKLSILNLIALGLVIVSQSFMLWRTQHWIDKMKQVAVENKNLLEAQRQVIAHLQAQLAACQVTSSSADAIRAGSRVSREYEASGRSRSMQSR